MKLERRTYGPESSPGEIKAIKDRIYLRASDVVMYEELQVQSVFHLDLFEEKLHELARGLRSYGLLIDLTEAEFPGAEIRARLKRLFASQAKLRAIAVYTGRNFLINAAAKYVLNEPYLPPFSVHTTEEEALAALARIAKAS